MLPPFEECAVLEPSIQPELEFKQHLASGRFMLLKDCSTGEAMFYPRAIAPRSGSTNLEWVEASGNATIHSFTIVSQRPPAEDYNVVLVDLAEGPRLMSRIDGIDPSALAIGMKVRSKIIKENSEPLLVFVPAE